MPKLEKADLLELRFSLILCVGLLLASAVLVELTWEHYASVDQELTRAIARENTSRDKLRRASGERDEIAQKIARYQEIEARGIIGQEARLDWIERIAQIKRDRRLIDVQYELDPQKAMDATLLGGSKSAGGFDFMASTMKLHMPLLTEYDLTGFLTDLANNAKALLIPRKCTLERIKQARTDNTVLRPQINADCTLDWVTLREKR